MHIDIDIEREIVVRASLNTNQNSKSLPGTQTKKLVSCWQNKTGKFRMLSICHFKRI